MSIHPSAAQGYELAADSYERGRPGYPTEVLRYLIDVLGIREGAAVLDLGAGTGKFTALLAASGARLLAVEPVRAMREKLAEKVPAATVLDGTAEAIPLASRSVDVVVSAQAFHWFDAGPAVAEIGRVLRPGGHVGLVWNVRDDSVEWVADLTRLVDAYEGATPRYRTSTWRRAFEESGLFTPLRPAHFRHVHRGPPEMVVDRVGSVSFIAALPEAERRAILTEVRQLLATHPATRGLAEIAFPYRTDTFVCSRTA